MKQAMVFAAGLGTRLKPLTNTMPKALVKVGGFALLEHNITKLKDKGFEHVVVNIHHFGKQIIDFLEHNNNFGIDIKVSDERAQLLNTGGGLKKAQHLFNQESSVLIHNVDILSDIDLQELTDNADQQKAAVLAISNRESASGRYLLFDKGQKLIGWTNVNTGEIRSPYPDVESLTALRAPFAGIHSFFPTLFPSMEQWPESFSIIDFYLSICKDFPIYGFLSDFHILDVGKIDSISAAERFLKDHPASSACYTHNT